MILKDQMIVINFIKKIIILCIRIKKSYINNKNNNMNN